MEENRSNFSNLFFIFYCPPFSTTTTRLYRPSVLVSLAGSNSCETRLETGRPQVVALGGPSPGLVRDSENALIMAL